MSLSVCGEQVTLMLYQVELDHEKSEAAARLIADVGEKLREAFAIEKDSCRLSLQKLAERLDSDRAHMHRALSGHNNMTLRTLAELAWAMDREVFVDLSDSKRLKMNDYLGYSCVRHVTTQSDIPEYSERRSVATKSHPFDASSILMTREDA